MLRSMQFWYGGSVAKCLRHVWINLNHCTEYIYGQSFQTRTLQQKNVLVVSLHQIKPECLKNSFALVNNMVQAVYCCCSVFGTGSQAVSCCPSSLSSCLSDHGQITCPFQTSSSVCKSHQHLSESGF